MKTIKVTHIQKGIRLDKFLASHLGDISRSKINRLIKEGKVSVNDKLVNSSYQVRFKDLIKLDLPSPKEQEIKGENIPLNIIYEDRFIVVIDKKEGMVVHPSREHQVGTLIHGLISHLSKELLEEKIRPGVVHRLDKGTSGLLVVAKTAEALENLKQQFRSRTVTKKYAAIVSGKLEPPVGIIEKPIAKDPHDFRKFCVSKDGKEAVTIYAVKEYLGKSEKHKFCLVELEPKTGRTHQLRVHLSSLGHPILGDRLYGGKPASRMFLHASYLKFKHPFTGRDIDFESKLPIEFNQMLESLRLK